MDLIDAVKSNNYDQVKYILLNENFDINNQDNYRCTALIYAINNINILELLLKIKNIDFSLTIDEGNTLLIKAVQAGQKNTVELLMKYSNNQNINTQNDNGKSAIMFAAEYGYCDIVRVLLDSNNVDLNLCDASGYTVLIYALKKGYHDIVILVINYSIDYDFKLDINIQDKFKMSAIMYGFGISCGKYFNLDALKLLLNYRNIDFNLTDECGNTVLIYATLTANVDLVELVIKKSNHRDVNKQNRFGKSAIMHAVEENFVQITKLLLQCNNVDLNLSDQYGDVPLTVAARKGYKQMVELLLNNNIITKINVNIQNCNGKSAIMCASEYGLIDIVELLLKSHEVDLNLSDKNGYTVLIHAVRNGYEEIIELLISYGRNNLDINALSKSSKSAFIYACQYGSDDIVELLLKCDTNLDTNIQSHSGFTAFNFANYEGNNEISDILKYKSSISY